MNEGETHDLVRAAVGGRRGVRLCRPIGTAAAVADIAGGLALAACRRHGLDPAATTLILVAHGAERDRRAQAPAERHARRIAARSGFAGVVPAFLEAGPKFPDVLARTTRPAVVVALFLGRGRHVLEDVEGVLARRQPAIAYAGSVGDAPALTELGLSRIRRAARRSVVRPGP